MKNKQFNSFPTTSSHCLHSNLGYSSIVGYFSRLFHASYKNRIAVMILKIRLNAGFPVIPIVLIARCWMSSATAFGQAALSL
ncbi:hypothetical protein CI610_01424 [invertebrate metagenome]|uniref:Uncharacterized protein n=1 Tax=invertebrate metagenome TaxID=1711999 RepID=A0A2H9T8P4_9ZZZZ